MIDLRHMRDRLAAIIQMTKDVPDDIEWSGGDEKSEKRISDYVSSGRATFRQCHDEAKAALTALAEGDTKEAECRYRAAETFLSDARLLMIADRARREGKGRDQLNRDKRFTADIRRDEIRQVWRPGMSAEDVRQAVIMAGGEAASLRTFQDDLKKMRLRKS
jgi:hypothetical protein